MESADRATFQFDQDAGDDASFVNEVAALVEGAVELAEPEAVLIVKIDSWFGSRWLGFSHKAMGAFGVANGTPLVIPPFVPNRVVSGRRAGRYSSADIHRALFEAPLLQRRSVGEMKEGVRRYIKGRHARR